MDHAILMWVMNGLLFIIAAGLFLAVYKFRRLLQQREEERMSLLITLSSLVELKDPYTEGHCARTRSGVADVCRSLGIPEQESADILVAATLHDLGKVGVPDAVLGKPGKLDKDEFAVIKRHPEQGAQALKALDRLKGALPMIRHHHEAFDGSGYPDGLKGEAIPMGARIIAVLDAYDAMTSERAYRAAMSSDTAWEKLAAGSGKQFDPRVVEAFRDYVAALPERTVDPVCGMPGNRTRCIVRGEITVHFCSEACKEEFCKNPDKYLPRLSQ